MICWGWEMSFHLLNWYLGRIVAARYQKEIDVVDDGQQRVKAAEERA